jgi:hypothetical protein
MVPTDWGAIAKGNFLGKFGSQGFDPKILSTIM